MGRQALFLAKLCLSVYWTFVISGSLFVISSEAEGRVEKSIVNAAPQMSRLATLPVRLRSSMRALTEKQRSIYLDLPSVFTTREGLSIALQHSMSERTFKDWIKTAIFKKLDYGTYEKRYK